ncbi:MAG: D-amino peptidase [Clostridia bacterium]|nr:D-amino peptidase [Clostridia bacterium]
MRLYISADMEGISGISGWQEIEPPSARHLKLLVGEINAAIKGALAAGAREIVVNDAHGSMRNIPVEELHLQAELITGSPKPLGMLAGLDSSFGAAFFIGYHGRAGSAGTLSHTFSDRVHRLRVNGREMGETGLNALLAGYFGVPVLLVAGDRTAVTEAQALIPGVAGIAVKEGLGYGAARCLHPLKARERIRQAAVRALAELEKARPLAPPAPACIEIEFQHPGHAEAAALLPGSVRVDDLTISYTGRDYLEVWKAARALITLSREG